MKPLPAVWRCLLPAVFLLAATPAFGQGKRPEVGIAQVRVWKGDFPSKRELKLNLRTPGRKPATTEIALSGEGYSFAEYGPIAAGTATFEVAEAQDAKNKLATLAATLAPGSFTTLILAENGERISLELINDTISATPARELRVRNFVPQLTSLKIEAGAEIQARLKAPDAFLHVRGVTEKKIQVRTSGIDPSGKPAQWSNEVDFSHSPRVTIVIYPDTYGRIRPRVVIDGQFLDQPPEGKGGKE